MEFLFSELLPAALSLVRILYGLEEEGSFLFSGNNWLGQVGCFVTRSVIGGGMENEEFGLMTSLPFLSLLFYPQRHYVCRQ